MPAKTHQTAVVAIPPPEAWPPIQAIRRQHDRQFRRWMPHITLLYPFCLHTELADMAPRLEAACSSLQPFDLELNRFRFFAHRNQRCTLWLEPQPQEALIQLQSRLSRTLPAYGDIARFANGFTPHLSVGQASGQKQAQALIAQLQNQWTPLRFQQGHIAIIWRDPPPGDIFQIAYKLPLGC